MEAAERVQRLRVYIGESDQWHGQPLYSAIVQEARKNHMAGATVVRGIEGFGANSVIHTARILRLSEDLPVIIEMVDRPEKIEAFLQILLPMVGGGMVTTDPVEILHYQPAPKDSGSGQ